VGLVFALVYIWVLLTGNAEPGAGGEEVCQRAKTLQAAFCCWKTSLGFGVWLENKVPAPPVPSQGLPL